MIELSLSTFDTFKHLDNCEMTVTLDDAELKALQSVLCGILRDIDDVCKRHNISYLLGGGTCLGAVRHQGIIPWDDDVDINMTRSDYIRFAEVYKRELSNKYWLHDCRTTPGYDLAFPRLRLKGTVVRNRDDWNNEECGAYIDIFIIEDAPNNALARRLHGICSMALGFLYSCRRFAANADSYLTLANGKKDVARVFKRKILIGEILSFLSVGAWTRLWDRFNSCVVNDSSSYVTIPVGRKHYFGELQPRDNVFPTSVGQFNGIAVPLPNNTDSYMKALYGEDYMTPPPLEQREKHVLYEFDLGVYDPRLQE